MKALPLEKRRLARRKMFFHISYPSSDGVLSKASGNGKFCGSWDSRHGIGFGRVRNLKLVKSMSAKSHKKQILLLDADLSVRDALASALIAEDYCVVPARDGREALSQFSANSIDLALLELSPGETESDWCTVQRLAEMNPRLPIVLMTAQAERQAHPLARHARACFQKPLLDLTPLLKKLSELTMPGNVAAS